MLVRKSFVEKDGGSISAVSALIDTNQVSLIIHVYELNVISPPNLPCACFLPVPYRLFTHARKSLCVIIRSKVMPRKSTLEIYQKDIVAATLPKLCGYNTCIYSQPV